MNSIFRKKPVKAGIIFLVIIFAGFLALNFIFPLRLEEISYSKQVLSADSTLLNAYLTPDDKWRLFVPLEDVNENFVETIIYKEDKWFYYHPGVNAVSIVKAFFNNVFSGRRVSGASTITMQLARMLEPKERTYFSKLKEVFRAFQLELNYSKERILEAYINLLPYGGNIEGVKAASYLYFNRPPAKLSLSQGVMLTIIPNDPNGLRPDRYNENLVINRNKWLKKLNDAGITNNVDYQNALQEKIVNKRYALPDEAPHFSRFAIADNYENIVYSTINRNLQKNIERRLEDYTGSLNSKGIYNGSVLIVDNKNSEIKVYAGSQNFYDKSHSGEVDGIRSVRSPGSTLKPFLYAFAMDKAGYTPARILNDIPRDFGGYSPENYDAVFNGPVRFDYALRNSLNLPAVDLLHETGTGRFISLLENGGFETIKDTKEDLGLSLILGGCGVTLYELTRMYSSFANDGEVTELSYTKENNKKDGEELFSPEASFLIFNILKDIERPDIPNEFLSESKLPAIAWKTGTSYGRRDAWAIGFNKDFTIGIWIGNFDGKGSPFLAGADIAVPLLFDVLNYTGYGNTDAAVKKSEKVKKRKVCAESGLLPGRYCENLINDYYIEGVSSMVKCNIERRIFTDEEETIQYCFNCLPQSGYKEKIIKVHSPEVELWMQKHGRVDKKIPHNPECTQFREGNNLSIVSPVKDYEYLISNSGNEKIALKAASNYADVVYWFINGVYIAKVKPWETYFMNPVPGITEISCMDDLGNSDKVVIRVKEF